MPKSLVTSLFLGSFLCTQAAWAQYPFSVKSLQCDEAQRVYCKMEFHVKAPDSFNANEWIVYGPVAPECPSQKDVSSRMTLPDGRAATEMTELSALSRPVWGVRVSGEQQPHSLDTNLEFWATLNRRHLSDKPASSAVERLAQETRVECLRASEIYDFNDPKFQSWIQTNHLTRTPGEKTLDFAWRAYKFISENYSYTYSAELDRKASSVCNQKATDCGGCSFLLVSVLRAQGIPARALVGRWAKSGTAPEIRGSGVLGTFHVKSEFFVDQLGWVPVDMSRALQGSYERVVRCFGHDEGKFLTMHFDPGIILQSYYFGEKRVRTLQSPAFWVSGNGGYRSESTLTWKVLPVNQKVSALVKF